VVALAEGGTADIVLDGVTGALVSHQDVGSISTGLERALALSDPEACVKQAASFSGTVFEARVRAWVADAEQGRL
jgi:hypothetical protein